MKLERWAVFAIALVALIVVWSRTVAARGNKTWNRQSGFFALADAIANAEGFGVPGAIPTVRNNPGDLKDGSVIATFPTPGDGWDALYRQLDLIRSGQSRFYSPDMTIGEVANIWTATEQGAWLSNVVASLRQQGYNVSADTPISEVLS